MEDVSNAIQGEHEKKMKIRMVVQEIVSKLPLRQREAVMLHYYYGLSATEVAEAMTVSLQSAADYLFRARRRIGAELSKRDLSQMNTALAALPMGALISDALQAGAEEYLSTKDAWLKRELDWCRVYIYAGSSEAAEAAEAAEATVAAPATDGLAKPSVRATFGVIMGTLTTFLIAGAFALSIMVGGAPQNKPAVSALHPVGTVSADGRQGALGHGATIAGESILRDGWDTIIDKEAVPLGDFIKREVLLFTPVGTSTWAMTNLILCLMGVLYAVMNVERVLLRRKREQKEYGERFDISNFVDIRELEDDRVIRSYRPTWLATSIAMAILGATLFLLTEDMREPMVMFNRWTTVHAINFAIELASVILVTKRKKRGGRPALAVEKDAAGL